MKTKFCSLMLILFLVLSFFGIDSFVLALEVSDYYKVLTAGTIKEDGYYLYNGNVYELKAGMEITAQVGRSFGC